MPRSRNVSRIHVRYKRFQKEQRDIWESFCIIDFYSPKIKDAIKKDMFPTLTIDRIWGESERTLKKNDTYGALSSLSSKGNYRRTLLEAVLTFEDYMSDIIQSIYLEFPNKLMSLHDNGNNSSSYQKLLKLILFSSDKEEMIEKLIEEKVRGIFYGNPLDVFEKDKAKLEFGSFFKDRYSSELNKFKLIVATRNIIAHNNGKIDRKYQREIASETQLGKRVVISREFLRDSIFILSLLAAQSTRLIIENIYSESPQGRLKQAIESFEK